MTSNDPAHTIREREISAAGFTNVDQQVNPSALVNYLDMAAGLTVMQQLKNLSFALLEPRQGAALLDVGCGTGDDVRTLAQMAGSAGQAVGTDISETMIAEARARSQGLDLPVEFRLCDAHRLDFPDDTFDGCRTERVLQHVEDPRRVLEEMIRVARPGARIVAMEPDWETLVIDAPDPRLTRTLLNFRADNDPHAGWIGRHLRGLFVECGLAEVEVHGMVLPFFDYAVANAVASIEKLVERAVAAGVVTQAEASAWITSLQAADAAGRFFGAMSGFVAAGRKR
jgi:ubiquinone/menaquinone biosynthesis C-methylase UbiE